MLSHCKCVILSYTNQPQCKALELRCYCMNTHTSCINRIQHYCIIITWDALQIQRAFGLTWNARVDTLYASFGRNQDASHGMCGSFAINGSFVMSQLSPAATTCRPPRLLGTISGGTMAPAGVMRYLVVMYVAADVKKHLKYDMHEPNACRSSINLRLPN